MTLLITSLQFIQKLSLIETDNFKIYWVDISEITWKLKIDIQYKMTSLTLLENDSCTINSVDTGNFNVYLIKSDKTKLQIQLKN